MPRRNSFNTFLAMAAGAATAVTAIEYTRQKRAAFARLGQGSRMIETDLGPAEVAEIGDGPAVLFSHGALSGFDQGVAVGKPLADASYRVISPSRPGYLRTPRIDDMSFAGQADFLAAVLDALKVDQAIVLGVSAGGPSAIQLAARHPDRVRALMLFCAISQKQDTDPENEPPGLLMVSTLMRTDFLTWLGVQMTIKSLPLMALAEPSGWQARLMASPRLRARYEKMVWTLFPSSPRLAGTLNDRALTASLEELPFKKVTAPTLVMHGALDGLVPFAHGQNSAEKIAGARFLPIRDADHAFFISHDDLVWPEALSFLQRPATAARKPEAKVAAAKSTAAKKPTAKKPAAKKPAARKPAAKKTEPVPRPAPRRRRTTTEG